MSRDHIIIDIETLTTSADAYLWEIGATAISEKKFSNFNTQISLQKDWREHDLDTIRWTNDQGNMQAVWEALDGGADVDLAMMALADWVNQFTDPLLWSWGCTFDFPILERHFKETGVKCPWHYAQVRCIRTLYMGLFPEEDSREKRPTAGNTHRAIDDAIHEAGLLYKCLNI